MVWSFAFLWIRSHHIHRLHHILALSITLAFYSIARHPLNVYFEWHFTMKLNHTQQTSDSKSIFCKLLNRHDWTIEWIACFGKTGRTPVSRIAPALEQLVHRSGYFQRGGHQDTRSLWRRAWLQTRKGHPIAPRGRGKALGVHPSGSLPESHHARRIQVYAKPSPSHGRLLSRWKLPRRCSQVRDWPRLERLGPCHKGIHSHRLWKKEHGVILLLLLILPAMHTNNTKPLLNSKAIQW